jgi:hypothetical protein
VHVPSPSFLTALETLDVEKLSFKAKLLGTSTNASDIFEYYAPGNYSRSIRMRCGDCKPVLCCHH